MLRAIRAMRSPNPDLELQQRKVADFNLIDVLISAFAGFLYRDDERPDKWEKLVSGATDADLLQARELAILMRNALCNSPYVPESFAPAAQAYRIAFAQQYFSAFFLVLALMLQQDSLSAKFNEIASQNK
jgi:hypothetical protein